MKLGPDKMIVEPLDDDRVTNLERRIVANAGDRLARPLHARRPWLAIGAACAAAVVAFVVGWQVKSHGAAVATETVVAAADVPLAIHTDATSSVLDIGDATIDSAPDTAYAVTRPGGGVLVDMARGRVALAVGKRANRPPLVVRAGDTDVIVVGTHFSVDFHDGTGAPDVECTEGIVRVVRRAQHLEVKVAAGHAWRKGELTTEVLGAGATNGATNGATIGATVGGDVVAAGGPVTSGSNGDVAMREHVAAVPDAHLPPPPSTGTGRDPALAGGPGVTRSPPTPVAIDPPHDPRGALKLDIRKVPLPSPVDTQASDDAGAIAKYYDMLLHRASPEDESRAMYGIAYTKLMRLGRTPEALAMISQYAERFTSKHYAEYDAVLWLKVRALCLGASSQPAECRQSATDYLRQASSGAPGRSVADLIVQ